ncbi:MAG: 16S rRNA (cytosine(1402)-N(4))-methyltransferase RsmH [Candidatus Omnitrophota bacterium]|nr:16S rRNA (cytosine(1402)-N(4))-methyltransferase RsmH [Candidatus Omnitrophota bacterium]
MLDEVIEYLRPKPGGVIIDCTIGGGGHSKAICSRIRPGGRLVGIDQDGQAIEKAGDNLKEFKGLHTLINDNFQNLDSILAGLKISRVDGILFDLGLSLFQIETPERGFSFRYNGPLDMRMNTKSSLKAEQLVNELSLDELSYILSTYGQERWANRIARNIVRVRKTSFIGTTAQLADIIIRAVPFKQRYYKINPATRTFQALRIVVNKELEILEKSLSNAISYLKSGARICVISFHSLEDRIVKNQFRQYSDQDVIRLINKKPLTPSRAEVVKNPRSRSAKLRIAEHL